MKQDNQLEGKALREKAEEVLAKLVHSHANRLPADNLKLIYELEVHQIELDMQNQELLNTREDAIKARDEYFELYDFAPTAYITLSANCLIKRLNIKATKMLDKNRSDLVNQNFNLYILPEQRIAFVEYFDRLLKNAGKSSGEFIIRTGSQSGKNVLIEGIRAGNNEDCLLSIIDITDLKEAEEAIKRKNIELADLNASKDKFFSIIAHDLRSPMAGFINLAQGMAENMQHLKMSDLEDYTKTIFHSATNLYKLLENLLEWSQLQRGLIQFKPKRCKLSSVISEGLMAESASAIAKDIELIYNIPDDIEIVADMHMINTVLRNLIANAIKFTPRGGKVEVGYVSMLQHHCIYVKDNGIGMSEDILEKLFQIDQVVKRPGTEKELSTGLGLLVCKEFIDQHKGKIWAESEEGKGSTFYITLPKVKLGKI